MSARGTVPRSHVPTHWLILSACFLGACGQIFIDDRQVLSEDASTDRGAPPPIDAADAQGTDRALPDTGADAGSEDADAGPLDAGPASCTLALGSGRLHHCAIRQDRALFCWGNNGNGQIGDGTTTTQSTPVEVLANVIDVMGGRQSTCAALGDRTRACWGENSSGQLGLSLDQDQVRTPTVDPDGPEVVAIGHGAIHGCALGSGGEVYCYGEGGAGRLAGAPSSNEPVVIALPPARLVEAGGSTSCAITRDDRVFCWGLNAAGQCGDGTQSTCAPAVELPSLAGASTLSLRDQHSCAAVDGDVFCWGTNGSGESGVPAGANVLVPTRVEGIDDVVGLGLGNSHSCALRRDGDVWCWGQNDEGELGDGANDSRHTPAPVLNLDDVVEINSASFSTCARRAGGEVFCWGRGDERQLAEGTDGSDATSPVLAFGCE